MKRIFIINGHQPYPFAKGRLNASFVDQAKAILTDRGYEVRVTEVAKGWDIDEEIANTRWADAVLMQFPVNWMSMPWSLKKYMDEVYTAGMDGRLCAGDGRSRENPSLQYGTGGTLTQTQYMLSLTFNAPQASFGNASQIFFEGKSVDDLMWPMHLNFKFFGMQALPTFSAHDVMKNPDVDQDFARFRRHINQNFPEVRN